MKKIILIAVFCFLYLFGLAQCPNAGFTINDYSTACPPLADSFYNTSTNVLPGATYYYDLGDGAHSTLPETFHIYGYAGTFYPKLIITNPGGCADTFQSPNPIVIGGPTVQSPTAIPSSGNAPLNVTLSLISNSVSFVWDFGDGSPLLNGASSVSHTYTIPGIYYPKVQLSGGFPSLCTYFFLVDTVNVTCTCSKPTNPFTTVLSNTKAKLNWTTQSCAIGYKVRYRKVGTTTWTNAIVGTNVGFKTINNLTPNTSYQWQVRSICQQTPLIQSVFTAMQTFTTPLRLEDESVTPTAFLLYPNPTQNSITISHSNLTGNYSLKIYNLLGQVMKQSEADLSSKENISIDVHEFPAGYYQLMLTNGSICVSKSFVKE